MWKWLGYTWRVVINFFYVAIVLYVFSRTYERDLTVIVALFGIIYVTMRIMVIGQVFAFVPMLLSISRAVDELKAANDLAPSADREIDFSEQPDLLDQHAPRRIAAVYDKIELKIKTGTYKLYIDMTFLSVISLICLFQLFSVL